MMKTALMVVTVALLLAIVSARGLRGDQGLIDSIERALIMEAFNDEVARIAMDYKQQSLFKYFKGSSDKPPLTEEQNQLIKGNRNRLLKGEEPWYISDKTSKLQDAVYMSVLLYQAECLRANA